MLIIHLALLWTLFQILPVIFYIFTTITVHQCVYSCNPAINNIFVQYEKTNGNFENQIQFLQIFLSKFLKVLFIKLKVTWHLVYCDKLLSILYSLNSSKMIWNDILTNTLTCFYSPTGHWNWPQDIWPLSRHVVHCLHCLFFSVCQAVLWMSLIFIWIAVHSHTFLYMSSCHNTLPN